MKVKITKEHENDWFNKFLGKGFQVTEDTFDHGYYKVIGNDKKWLRENDTSDDDIPNEDIDDWCIPKEDCEEVKELKVGDKVRVTDKVTDCRKKFMGKIGKIMKVCTSDMYPYWIDFDGNGESCGWCFNDEELEPVPNIMTLKDAQKVCIDGQRITVEGFN